MDQPLSQSLPHDTGLHLCRRSDPLCYARSITVAMLTGASSALQLLWQVLALEKALAVLHQSAFLLTP